MGVVSEHINVRPLQDVIFLFLNEGLGGRRNADTIIRLRLRSHKPWEMTEGGEIMDWKDVGMFARM